MIKARRRWSLGLTLTIRHSSLLQLKNTTLKVDECSKRTAGWWVFSKKNPYLMWAWNRLKYGINVVKHVYKHSHYEIESALGISSLWQTDCNKRGSFTVCRIQPLEIYCQSYTNLVQSYLMWGHPIKTELFRRVVPPLQKESWYLFSSRSLVPTQTSQQRCFSYL